MTACVRQLVIFLSLQKGNCLLLKGKYNCMADLLFILLGFICFAYAGRTTDLFLWSNPNQSNRMVSTSHFGECSLAKLSVMSSTAHRVEP